MNLNNSYRKFKIPKINDKQKISFNFPNKCLICDSKNVNALFKYKVKKKYLEIPLCDEHLRILEAKPSLVEILKIPFISAIFSIIISISIFFFIQNSSFFSFVILINMIIFLAFFFKGLFKIGYSNCIMGKIFEKFKINENKDSYVVFLKNTDLNLLENSKNIEELKINQHRIRKIDNKVEKGLMIYGLWFIINIPFWIIFRIVVNIDIISFKLIFYFAFVVVSSLFLMILVSYSMKSGELKTTQLTLGKKIIFYILWIFLFLLITAGYFSK